MEFSLLYSLDYFKTKIRQKLKDLKNNYDKKKNRLSEEKNKMIKIINKGIMQTNKNAKAVFIGFSFVFVFIISFFTNISLVNAADTTPPSVNMTYSSNTAGVGIETITATYSEAISSAPTISINQPGTLDISNASMTAPGSVWVAQNPSELNNWQSVAYGNGLFVAVAQTGTNRVMTSPDGITWTARTAALVSAWYSVVFANNQFVAVGQNSIMTSPDGITWTSRTSPQANDWRSVTYGNNLYVAVSSSGTNRVMTSPDGITWTLRNAASALPWFSVTYGNGLFVSVASIYNTANVIMTSPDGVTWTTRTTPVTYYMYSVTYGNGMFVSAGPSNTLTSPDGINWTNRSVVISYGYSSTYGNGLFVIGSSSSSQIATSPDGINWTGYLPSNIGQAWYGLAYGNGKFISVSSNGNVASSNANYIYNYLVNKANGSTYIDGTATVSLSSVTDIAGNTSNLPTNNTFVIDTTGPTVSLSYTVNRAKAGINIITAVYSESIVGTPLISINQPGSIDIINAPMTGSGTTWNYSYTVNVTNGSTYIDGLTTVSLSQVTNASGKVSSYPTNNTFVIDTTQPTVIYSYNPNPAKAGTQTIVATYSEDMIGTPTISIDQPGNADIINAPMTNIGGIVWTSRTPTSYNFQSVTYGNGLFVAIANNTNTLITSPDGINWTNRGVPENNQWMSVAYGNGMFVAVSANGTNRVMTSPDGITWTARPAAENNSWYSVTYGNGMFVAVATTGTNRVMTSPDGIIWIARSVPENNNWQAVTYGNGVFVAVSNDGTNRVMTSPDGITWTARSAATSNWWQAVTYGNGLFVAVGYGAVMTSADGITWTSRTAAEANTWSSVTYGNGIFVAVAVDGTNRVMTSPDGITWTARVAAEADSWSGVAYGNGMFVAVATTGTNRVMTSSIVSYSYTYNINTANGSTYIDGPAIVSLSSITDTAGNTVVPQTATNAVSGNRFVIDTTSPSIAINYSSNTASTGTQTIIASYSEGVTTTPTISIDQPGSTDIINATMMAPGSVWTSRTSAQASGWLSMTYGNGLFVAVANSGTNRVMTSPDGINWTVRNAATNSEYWRAVTYGNGMFVAIAEYGQVMTSPDGINWTQRISALGNYIYNIAYANGLFVVVGSAGVMTSPNGISWTARTPAVSTQWYGITYANNLFVAVSTGGQIMTSPDGINWTQRTSPATGLYSVAYGNGLFVATYGSQIITSPDAITWTQRTSPISYLQNVIYGDGLFVVTSYSGNQFVTSSDGINWTTRTVPSSSSWYAIAYNNKTFVSLVYNSTIAATSRGGGYYYDYTVNKANGSTYLDGTTNVSLSSTQDYAGNIAQSPSNSSFTINTSAATVALSYTRSRTSVGTQTITATYSKAIVGTPTISIDQPGSTDIVNAPMTGNGTTWTYAYTVNMANGSTYMDGTATVSLSSMTDVDGNISLAPTNNTFVIDTSSPTVAITYSSDPAKAGTETITATYSESVSSTPSISIDQPGSIDIVNAPMTGSGTVFTYDYIVHGANGGTYIDGVATVSLSSVTDTDDNLFMLPTNNTFTIDTKGTSVLLSYSSNPITAGVETITATYSKEIIGIPNISINQPGLTDILNAPMTGSGKVFTYNYTVNQSNGSTYVDGVATVSLSTMIDVDGNTSTSPSNNTFTIDTSSLSVAISYSSNPTTVGTQTITATYSKAIVGTPTISIDQPGSTDIVNAPMTGNGTTWTYAYTVNMANGSTYMDGTATVSLSSVVDSAGNTSSLPSNNTFSIQTSGPIVSLSYSSDPVGVGIETITASYSETVTGIPNISINQPGTVDINNVPMSAPASVWNSRTAISTNAWYGVTYANGIFVAVSNSNQVMTSPDGIVWTSRTSATTNIYSITYGNGLFVAVGSNSVMTSPDGITWTSRTPAGSSSWMSVAYGNGLFVAVGSTAVMTSPNGITWTSRTAQTGSWNGIAYGNGTFVAVAYSGATGGGIMTSPDAITWTLRTAPYTNYWQSVTYANNLFVAVNYYSQVATSTDGINWVLRPTTSGNWYSVAYGNGLYVLVGSSAVSTSPDGITWTARTAQSGNWYSVAYGNGTFVAVSLSGTNQVMTSPGLGYTYDYIVSKDNGSSFVDGVATVSLSPVVGISGKISNAPSNNTFTISTSGPTVNLTYTANRAKAGSQLITATYSEPIVGTPTISINQPGTTDITNASMTNIGGNIWTYNYVVNTTNGGTYVDGIATVSLSSTSNSSGKITSAPSNNTFVIDTTLPTVAFNYSSNPIKSGTESIVAVYSEEMIGTPTISIDQPGSLDITNAGMTNNGGSTWTSRAPTAWNWQSIAYGNNLFVAVTNSSNSVATSPDGINWTNRTIPETNQWSSVVYANNMFVAVAATGTNRVMTSTDGITWTARLAAEANAWQSVTYGNGLFVAVAYSGTNRVMTSPDGITWTSRSASGNNSWQSVTYGNGLFVAVSNYGTNQVMTSPDGITWTARNASNLGGWQSVTYGNGLFVAVAYYGTNQVMTSPDGITWTSRTAAEANSWYGISYGYGTFIAVAVDGTNRVMISADGINWTAKTASEANSWQAVTYGNGLFVAVANSGTNRIMTSPAFSYLYNYPINTSNGSTYIDGQASVNLSSTTDLAGNPIVPLNSFNQTNGNRFVIDTTSPTVSLSYSSNPAGTGTETIYAKYSESISSTPTVSIDQPGTTDISSATMIAPGSVWVSRTASQSNYWRSLVYANGIFVAVADGGAGTRVMTSPDGITWTNRNSASASAWQSVAYGNGLFVAVGAGAVMTSPNGINWTSRTPSEGNSWNSVVYNNGLFVAVASNGTNRVMTSTDGINWVARQASEANNWISVTYGNGLFVAVSSGGTSNAVMTSPDGINWTARATPYSTWYSLAYGNGMFVAVYYNKIMSSFDGINWTVRTSAITYPYAITYGDGLFVVVPNSGNLFMTSSNGINWTAQTATSNTWYTVAYGNKTFVALAYNTNSVITSRGGGYYYDYTVVKANGSTYLDGQANVTLSSTQDNAGNVTSAPTGNSFTIDTSSSSVDLSYSSNPASVGVETITATYSKAIVGTPTISINQPGSTDIVNASMTGSGTTWTYAYTVNASNGSTYIDGTATVSLSTVVDVDGNNAKLPTNNTFVIDTGSPTAAITYSVNHPVKSGSSITITATFSEPMADAPITKIAIAGANTLAATNMTKVDSTHYTYVHTVGAGDGAATVSLSVGTDMVSNIITSVPTSGVSFVVDNTNPTISITPICNPGDNQCTASGQSSSPQESYNVRTISGTASGQPAGGSISSVEISIKDTIDNKWYNGTSFVSLSENYLQTVGTTAWNYSLVNGSLTIGHTYLINIKATDEALNTGIQSLNFKFTNSPPIISNVTAVQNVSGEVAVTYDVTDSESTQTTNYLFYGVGATLNGEVLSNATSLTVSDGTNFPISGTIIIEDEIISYVSKAGNILQGLTRGALNTTSFIHNTGLDVYIKANSTVGGGVGVSDIGLGKTITWLAQTDATQYESPSTKVKVVANDGSISSMLGFGISPSFSIDASKPTSTVTFDAGVAGVTNSATINIPMPQDSQSAVQYLIRDDNATQTNPRNTGWTSITADTVIPWTFDSDVEAKTLKYQFRDAYNNVTPEQTISTHTPIPSSSFIIQDTSNVSVAVPYYDVYIGWQSTEGTGFSSYKLEQATSTDNITYGNYSTISDSSFSYISTNYYVYRNLDPNLFYKFRLSVVNTSGNTSVRTKEIIVKPDAVQNYGEGGGGSALTAPKVENVVVTQNENKSVKVDYRLTDSSFAKKINPSYESYVFYNIGITLPSSALVDDTIKVSNASKLKSSGYIQINNEVISYTGKTGNTLTGITRSTWPTVNSTGRATRINSELFEGTPVWIMANSTTPISVTNNTIATGQNNSINWNAYSEIGLVGSTYNNVDIKVLVHDNQDVLSGPLSSQNDYSENGVLNSLDLSAPTISFENTSSSGLESSETATFKLNLGRIYPIDSTVAYTVTGTAVGGGVDYTLANGVATILAGETSVNITASIVNHNLVRANKTIIITLSNPTNSVLGINTVHTYTIINHGADNIAPVVSLVGANPIHILAGNTFTDPGATATDDIDGDVTSSIVVTGLPNINVPSLNPYVVTYTATDGSGNTGTITRNVYVDDINAVYHITASAGLHGKITPSGVSSVNYGSSLIYNLTPQKGYSVTSLVVDGISVDRTLSYTFTNVTSDHTIIASFGLVPDTTAPVITLNGASPMYVTKDSVYKEPGATAIDTVDGSRSVVISGSVVTSVVGVYTITYTSTDIAGNVAVKTRIVNVTLSPTYNIVATSGAHGKITPNGTTSVVSGTNQIYTITPDVGFQVATLTVDGIKLATGTSYTFTNVVASHTISATFTDIAAPVITLNGANPMSITKDSTYTEPGATALDALDGSRYVNISGVVVTSVVGQYPITYTATDVAGNISSVTRIVNVTLSPTYNITATSGSHGSITPSGISSVASGTNQTYIIEADSGFDVDTLVVDGVSLAPASEYTFTNVVASHTISATFTDIAAPVITLNGANPMSITKDSTYTEPGATALDAVDGTRPVTITGSVATSVAGSYTITYTATDSSGNLSVATRIVNVTLSPTYNITATSGSHGRITPSGVTGVPSGSSQIYNIEPEIGYEVSTLVVDGISLAPSTIYTFTNVVASHTISATFTDIAAPVITLNGANPMSITKDSTYTEPGATATDALDGDRTVTISGTVNTAVVGSYTITYTASDIAGNTATVTRTVEVVLATTYDIVASAGANGTISPSGTTSVVSGTNQTYVISPNQGYIVKTLVVDGLNLAVANSYTFNNVNASHNINVTFDVVPDLVPPVITLNGANPMSITKDSTYTEPGATATDALDGDRTVTISGTVNTAVVGSYTITYTASDIAGNTATVTRTVEVVLATTYDIVASAGANGTISPSGTTSVVSGTNQTYTITPDEGYSIDSLTVDGVRLAASNTYTFENVIKTHTIDVTFTLSPDITPPTITILGDNPMSIVVGDTFTDPGVEATDDRDGDITSSVKSSGTINTSAVGSYIVTYTVSDAAKNSTTVTRTINVIYAATYDIISTASSNGTISPLGTTAVSSGTNQTYTITPSENYKVSSLIVDGVALAIQNTYTFENVIKTHTIDVMFAPSDSVPPIVTILGDNPMNINTGDVFVDPGATAADAVTGDPLEVVVSGNINTSVASTDNKITYSATDSYGNTTVETRIVNVHDITGPVITNIAVPVKTQTVAVITWDTDEPTTSQVYYGVVSGSLSRTTVLDTTLSIHHAVTLSAETLDVDGNTNILVANTPYFYQVSSNDAAGNNTVSVENTLTTDVVISSGGGHTTIINGVVPDTTAPEISGVEVSEITAFGAAVSFTTNEDTLSFVEYGKDTSYGDVFANNKWSKEHKINLRGLKLGTDYHAKVVVVDKSGNLTSSPDDTFKTKFFSENAPDLVKVDNIEQFQNEIESTIESILPALVPPFIEEPKIKDINENGATITFRTNIKTYPVVSYATDGTYDAKNENPYTVEVSDMTEKKYDHELILTSLKPNTKYHLQARAFSLPQVIGKSVDLTFTTSASKIQGSILDVKKDSFNVVWSTDELTTSIVEYKNLKSGRVSRLVDESKNSSHSIKVENLSPGTSYEVKISGLNEKGNIVEGGAALNVRTSTDSTPPSITNLKVESALIVGRTDKVQTIISWNTDEPSTSYVYFEEGTGSSNKTLSNKQGDSELTKNHVVILSSLKSGTIYRFTVESKDDANNVNKPPVRTIITPKKTESIVDVIFKNFDETFNFINNVK